MNKSTTAAAALCVFALTLGAMAAKSRAADQAANVTGTWQLTAQSPRGPVTQTLTIHQDGGKITGTMKGGRGPDADLEGTVDGNNVTFTVKRGRQGEQITITYSATVDGDTMKGSMKAGEFSREWTATRQK